MAQRPQQPTTGAPAASLPTETLAQILACALEGLEPWEKQQERARLSKVCSGWYQVAETGKDLVVKGTKMGLKLAQQLWTSDTGDDVQSLTVTLEEIGTGRGSRLGDLLVQCIALTKLDLLEFEPLGASGGTNQLGKPVTEALSNLASLKHLTVTCRRVVYIDLATFLGLLEDWPSLETLILRHVYISDRTHDDADDDEIPEPALVLKQLSLPLSSAYGGARWTRALKHLLKASSQTIETLDIGPIWGFTLSSLTPETLATIVAIAPRLRRFTCRTNFSTRMTFQPTDCLLSILKAVRDVEHLHLGLAGYPLSDLFTLLQPLQHLKRVSVLVDVIPQLPPFDQITPAAAIQFLSSAPSIKSLVLPVALKDMGYWTPKEIKDVEAAAEAAGASFVLA